MAEPVRIVHYINQFFAGIGGEEKGSSPVEYAEGPKGPGLGLSGLFKRDAEIVRTIWCGDNLINEHQAETLPKIVSLIKEAKADLLIAGPAFNAGRYGLACGMVAKAAREDLGIPSIIGLFPENPAVEIYKRDTYIVPVGETAAKMRDAIPKMAPLAVKLGKKGKLDSALADGYIQSGFRYNEYVEHNAAHRAIEMLVKRLKGQDPQTEVPLRSFEQVPAALPVKDMKSSVVAIVTGGGMVPKGNPDSLKQAFADAFGVYSLEGLSELPAGDFKGIHGGYDSTWVDQDPDRVVPLDALRDLEKEGRFAKLLNEYYALCGIGTNVAMSKKLGSAIAEELKRKQVAAAIFTST